MERVFLNVLGAFAAVFAVAWAFNHINVWVGIGMAVVIIYLLIRFFKKLI